jgi:hypothetical protein
MGGFSSVEAVRFIHLTYAIWAWAGSISSAKTAWQLLHSCYASTTKEPCSNGNIAYRTSTTTTTLGACSNYRDTQMDREALKQRLCRAQAHARNHGDDIIGGSAQLQDEALLGHVGRQERPIRDDPSPDPHSNDRLPVT